MGCYKEGDIVQGIVTGIEEYGIFVLVDEKITGLIHISEISEAFVRDVSDYAELGETIKAMVLDYDSNNHKLKLSVKNLDYRDNKNAFHVIKETGSGFLELEKSLPKWISEKEEENVKKSKKTVNNVDKSVRS